MISLLKLRQQRPDLQKAYDASGKAIVEGVPKNLIEWYNEYGKDEVPELASTDFNAENQELQTYVDDTGSYPTRPEDFSLLAEMAYDNPSPELMDGLPRLELDKKAAFEDAYGEGGDVKTAQEAGRTAGNRLSVLQDALKTKTGAYDAGIGKSKVFQEAGLSGMGSLMQSLNSRRQEISNSYERHRREISDMADIISSENQRVYNEANLAIQRYNEIKEEYDREIDYLRQIETEERRMDQELKLYKQKLALDAQYEQASSSGVSGFIYDKDTLKALDQQQEDPTQSFIEEKMAEFEASAEEMIMQQNQKIAGSQKENPQLGSLLEKENVSYSPNPNMSIAKSKEKGNETIWEKMNWLGDSSDSEKRPEVKSIKTGKLKDLFRKNILNKKDEEVQLQELEKNNDYYETQKEYIDLQWKLEKARYKVNKDPDLRRAARAASAKLAAGTPYTIALEEIQSDFKVADPIEAEDVLFSVGYPEPQTEEEIIREERSYAKFLYLQGDDEKEISRKLQSKFKETEDAAREIANSVMKNK